MENNSTAERIAVAVKEGWIDKSIDHDGVVRYKLTALGVAQLNHERVCRDYIF